jgi:hypothetical protein
MNIEKAKREFVNCFYEDDDYNVIDRSNFDKTEQWNIPENARYCTTCFPLEIIDDFQAIYYQPKSKIVNYLCSKSGKFNSFIQKKYNSKKKMHHSFSCSMNISKSKETQDCIINMVLTGDFTLEEALYVYSHSCERCSNALIYKYTNGEDGYPEFSEQWFKTNTCCPYCYDPTYKKKKLLNKRLLFVRTKKYPTEYHPVINYDEMRDDPTNVKIFIPFKEIEYFENLKDVLDFKWEDELFDNEQTDILNSIRENLMKKYF